jgi:hypothetical protein
VPGPGVVTNKPSNLPGMYKNSAKNGWFPALTAFKITENAVFYLKVLNKIYSQDVF